MKKLICTLLAGSLLSACAGGSGGGGASSAGPKNLFSVWTRDDNTDSLNLDGGNFGSNTVVFVFPAFGNAHCTATGVITGTQASGSYAISSVTWNGDGTNPGCTGYTESGTFTKGTSTLTFCDTSHGPTTCYVYE